MSMIVKVLRRSEQGMTTAEYAVEPLLPVGLAGSCTSC